MKIRKQDLRNIIVESIAEHMSDEDLMDSSKECPQGWKDADCMVNKINNLITSNLKSILADGASVYGNIGAEHQEKIVNDLIFALEEPLLDLALELNGNDDDYVEDVQGPGDELNMSARFAKKGSRNFGKQENEN